MSNQPDLTKFRGAIFWDTAIENIDFTAHRGYVINRIFECLFRAIVGHRFR